MEGKKIIINQAFGLGDLLWIEPICRWYHEQGYKVILPVDDHYYWLMYYIRYIHYKEKSGFKMDYEQCHMDYKHEEIPVVPLRFSTPILRGCEPHDGELKEHFMLDKYRLLDLPLDMWRTLQWTRNMEKEQELYDFLELKKPYTLVNLNFGGGLQRIDVKIEGVQMRPINKFTLLDWSKVIEEAEVIHTVETSVIYMIETLDIKAKEIHMYPRTPYEKTLKGVKNFISDKWILHPVKEL